jgi:CRISPR-associated protein Cmr3
MRIFIQPCELLLFRTGHPFNAGENHYADTLFPPTPETLQGALRATIASHWNPDKTLAEVFQEPELVALIGDQEHYGHFSITGIALGRRSKNAVSTSAVERLFPVPTHFLIEESGENQPVRLQPRPHSAEIACNLPATMQLLYPDRAVQSKLEPLRGWLSEQSLQKVLRGQEPIGRSEVIDPTTVYIHELRQGIGINNQSKTTADGQFYQTRMIRMNHCSEDPFIYGFIVDIRLQQTTIPGQFVADEQTQRLLRLPDEGWMILGGERRAARFEMIFPSSNTVAALEQRSAGNLLYLATPAAFAQGWQPQTWPTLEPIAVAMERYQPIGGWQLHPGHNGGKSKTLRRCVPAGSMYFFNSSVPKICPFTDYGSQIGYGITYAGDYAQ